LCALCLLLALAASAPSASAAIAVSNLNDSGAGSLREAIKDAVAGETITVPAGQITLTSGPLAIAKDLTIAGAGSAATSISGNDASRVLTITATPTVTLSGLTITHGNNTSGAGISATGGTLTLQDVTVSANHAGGEGKAGFGGGIEFTGSGKLSLTDSAVSRNTAGGGFEGAGFGGAIEYEPGADGQSFALSLTRTRVTGNSAGGGGEEASGFGGAIESSTGFNSGTISLSLVESAVSNNAAGGGGVEASGFGGGVDLGSGGNKNALTLSIDRSGITGNKAGGGGEESSGFGGGVNFASGGAEVTQTLTVSNSTISANSAGGGGTEADGFGGGVSFGSGTATLSYVTVAANSAGGTGGSAFGGGLDMGPVGTGGIGNSIVAANAGGNCSSAITSTGHNIDDGASCGFKGTGDKSGVDARLGPLGEHGGISSTQMPLAGSPAIDGADPATCPSSDQRGVARPQAGGCDIGAVEVAPPVVTTNPATSVSAVSAVVGGSVNPNFSATSYHVDWGTSAAYGNFTAETGAGEGGTAQVVSATIDKLKPQTLYHFRVVANNPAGTVVGGDQTLTTGQVPPTPIRKKRANPLRVPALNGARLTNRRFRVGRNSTATFARLHRAPVGTSFRFKLTAAATVKVTITRSAGGLRRGRRCLAPSAKLRRAHARRCTRTIVVGVLTRANLRASADRIAFSGRIGRRALRPGFYRAVLRASNAAGHSAPVALTFVVVR
jgi:hypothetical protein